MILLTDQPKLTDLHNLINEIESFPVTASELIRTAIANNYPHEVITFYSAFPPDIRFTSKDDLAGRTEALETLMTENPPIEDNIHGAED